MGPQDNNLGNEQISIQGLAYIVSLAQNMSACVIPSQPRPESSAGSARQCRSSMSHYELWHATLHESMAGGHVGSIGEISVAIWSY